MREGEEGGIREKLPAWGCGQDLKRQEKAVCGGKVERSSIPAVYKKGRKGGNLESEEGGGRRSVGIAGSSSRTEMKGGGLGVDVQSLPFIREEGVSTRRLTFRSEARHRREARVNKQRVLRGGEGRRQCWGGGESRGRLEES